MMKKPDGSPVGEQTLEKRDDVSAAAFLTRVWAAEGEHGRAMAIHLAEALQERARLRAENQQLNARVKTAESRAVRLEWALLDVCASGVEMDDARLDYLMVQIDRSVWDQAYALIEGADHA